MPQPVYGPPAGRLQAVMRSKWFMPLSSLGLGVVILAASWLGGHPGSGLVSLAIMGATSGSPRSTCGRPRWPGWC
jgi:hypothetical protein